MKKRGTTAESVSTVSNERFLRAARLTRREQFDRVLRMRVAASDPFLTIHAAANDQGTPRLGLIVSRKVGNAIQRNRWKRSLREAFRTSHAALPLNCDLVAIPRSTDLPPFGELRRAFVSLAQRAGRKALRSRSDSAPAQTTEPRHP